jgi:RNA polymerase sigma factor (sigma-70 family)
MTDAQREELAKYIVDYPYPIRALRVVFPSSYRRARHLGLEDDDINQLCYFGAMKAASKFDFARNTSFATLAVEWMRAELSLVCAGLARKKRTPEEGVLIYRPDRDSEFGEPGDRWGWVPGRSNETAMNVKDLIDEAFKVVKLDAREHWILRSFYGLDGNPPQDGVALGKQLGVCKERIRQILTVAKNKLRDAVEQVRGLKF